MELNKYGWLIGGVIGAIVGFIGTAEIGGIEGAVVGFAAGAGLGEQYIK
jgi:hypothetical protein